MSQWRKLNTEEKTAAISSYTDNGMMQKEMGLVFGTHPRNISSFICRHGIKTKTARTKNFAHVMDDNVDVLQELYHEGNTIAELAALMDCSIASVNRCLKRHGIKRRERSFPGSPGKKSGMWKGGRYQVKRGYWVIHKDLLSPKEQRLFVNMFNRNRVLEHRLVMARHLGRPLTVDEVVHHIDYNNERNDISNLRLMAKGEHASLHGTHNYQRTIQKGAQMALVVYFNVLSKNALRLENNHDKQGMASKRSF